MNLILPEQVLDSHAAVLGKTGKGKSSTLRHLVEYLLSHKKRTCIIDPKGDWWGLKFSADGKGKGFDIINFGDFKREGVADIPINPQSGKHLAELVTSGNRPCVIGMRGWMPSDMNRFWIDFASTVFNSNSAGGLHLFISEIQNFAPKELAGFGGENMGLHWAKRLLSEGRGIGLSIFIDSQRPQSVHNGILTQCETLIAMGLIHDADCKAVENWLSRCRDKQARAEIMTSLPDLKRGEAWVWSPELNFGPKRMSFPMFSTFDSFAPPQEQKKISLRGWEALDLEEVKKTLASVIEEAKATDPKEMSARNRQLTMQVEKLQREIEKLLSAHQKKAVPLLSKVDRRLIDRGITLLDGIFAGFQVASDKAEKSANEIARPMVDLLTKLNTLVKLTDMPVANQFALRRIAPPATAPAAGIPISAIPNKGENSLGTPSSLPAGEKKCLIAIAQHSDGVERDQLSVLTQFKRSSRDAYISRLKAREYITEQSGRIVATDAAIEALGADYEPLPMGRALIDHWLAILPAGEAKVFKTLVESGGLAIHRDELDQATGFKRSSRDSYISRLIARRIVESPSTGYVCAVKQLFS